MENQEGNTENIHSEETHTPDVNNEQPENNNKQDNHNEPQAAIEHRQSSESHDAETTESSIKDSPYTTDLKPNNSSPILNKLAGSSSSLSSLSSVNSTHSTDDLVKSLANANFNDKDSKSITLSNDDKEPSITSSSPTSNELPEVNIIPKALPKSVASKANFYNELSNIETTDDSRQLPKKAIKFTVRKVSRETIKLPTTSTTQYKAKRMSPQQSLEVDSKDAAKLRNAQTKYDQYKAKIAKIEKEINFLNNLLPPYNLEVDYNTRTKIVNAISKLNGRKDEIEKKKYDLGMIISRLWRVQEGTDIWVRSFDKK